MRCNSPPSRTTRASTPGGCDTAHRLPAALDIARSTACRRARRMPFSPAPTSWSALDDRLILKIFPPLLRRQFVSERGALSALCGRLTVADSRNRRRRRARRLALSGDHPLPGVLGKEAWPPVAEGAEGARLVRDRHVIAEVQRAPVGALAEIEPRWDVFMRGQIAGCRARHARLGLAAKISAMSSTICCATRPC